MEVWALQLRGPEVQSSQLDILDGTNQYIEAQKSTSSSTAFCVWTNKPSDIKPQPEVRQITPELIITPPPQTVLRLKGDCLPNTAQNTWPLKAYLKSGDREVLLENMSGNSFHRTEDSAKSTSRLSL